MKTIIDRDFTTLAKVQLVKNHLADFKAIFTENDLVRMHNEEWNENAYGEVLKCTVTGFNKNSYSDDVSFRIEMVIENVYEFVKLAFYMDSINGEYSITHDEEDILHTYEVYREVR